MIDITASIFDFSAIVTDSPGATALELNSADGMIINSKFFAEETNTIRCAVRLNDCAVEGH